MNGRRTSFRQGSSWCAGVLCERLLLSLGLASVVSSQSFSKTPCGKRHNDLIPYNVNISIRKPLMVFIHILWLVGSHLSSGMALAGLY